MTGWLLGPSAQAAPAPQLTGTQLASALLPASYFGSGYKVSKPNTYNSGRGLEHAKAKYHLATFSCQKYLNDGMPNTGFGETATAGTVLLGNSGRSAYQQAVYQFASPAQAAAFYQQLYAFTVRCRTITVTDRHGTAKLTTQSLKKTHLGHLPAFSALQTITLTGFPATVNNTLTTVAGADVYFIDALGQKVPSNPSVPAALQHLIARVQAVR